MIVLCDSTLRLSGGHRAHRSASNDFAIQIVLYNRIMFHFTAGMCFWVFEKSVPSILYKNKNAGKEDEKI